MNVNQFLATLYTPSPTFIYTLKWVAILTFVCVAYIIGYRTGYSPILVSPSRTYEIEIEKEVIKEKIVEKTLVKWRKSKTVKPDGTTKEVTEWTDSQSKTETTQLETIKVKEKEVTKPPAELTTWAISAGRSINQVNNYSVSRRMLGDLWLEVEVNTTKDIGLNVRYEY